MERKIIKLTKEIINEVRDMVVNELDEEELEEINPYSGTYAVFDLFYDLHPERADDLDKVLNASEEEDDVADLVNTFLDEVENELVPDNYYQEEDDGFNED